MNCMFKYPMRTGFVPYTISKFYGHEENKEKKKWEKDIKINNKKKDRRKKKKEKKIIQ